MKDSPLEWPDIEALSIVDPDASRQDVIAWGQLPSEVPIHRLRDLYS